MVGGWVSEWGTDDNISLSHQMLLIKGRTMYLVGTPTLSLSLSNTHSLSGTSHLRTPTLSISLYHIHPLSLSCWLSQMRHLLIPKKSTTQFIWSLKFIKTFKRPFYGTKVNSSRWEEGRLGKTAIKWDNNGIHSIAICQCKSRRGQYVLHAQAHELNILDKGVLGWNMIMCT